MIDNDKLLAPISASAPCGEDARYEFHYELMEAEVKKFGSLFGETVNWGVVKNYAIEVLCDHSKDLKAICYLTRALGEEHQLAGVLAGMTLLNGALSQYGAALHPQRKRGRDGAVEWLNHQLKLLLGKYSDGEVEWASVNACLTQTEQLQAQFDQVFADSEADFFDLRSALNALSQRASAPIESAEPSGEQPLQHSEAAAPLAAPQTPSSAPQAANTPATSASANPAVATPAPSTVKAPAAAVKKAQPKEVDVDTDFSTPTASKRSLKKVAETMLSASPRAPLAYRLYRHLTWSEVDGLPEHQNQQTALILAVSADQQADYRDKAAQGGDVDTIKRLERTLTDAPFWLTGHYLVSLLLKQLGFNEAAAAVKDEVSAFVRQYPGIEALQFKNSLPFADEATLNWLSTPVAGAQVATPMLDAKVLDEQSALAVDEVTLANLGEYAEKIAARLAQDSSGRGQFLLYLQLVKAYHSVGLFTLCLPYLEKVWLVRKEINLSSWEPHLSLQLDVLSQKTLNELYPKKEQLPEKYQDWKHIYD